MSTRHNLELDSGSCLGPSKQENAVDLALALLLGTLTKRRMAVPENELPVAARTRACLWLDLGCITALLVLAAMPLIVLRDLTWPPQPPTFAVVFCTLGGCLGALWLALARRL